MSFPEERNVEIDTLTKVKVSSTQFSPNSEKVQNGQKKQLTPVEKLKIQNTEDAKDNYGNSLDTLNTLSQLILEEAFEEIRTQSIIPALAAHKTPKAIGPYGEIIRRILRLDQYGQYLPQREYSTIKKQLSGDSYAGVGMHISQDLSGAIIAESMSGSPAEKAGIQDGDVLVAIDSVAIHGRTILEVSSRIRGVTGSTVNITYQRNNAPAETVTIRREKFMERSVLTEQNENLRYFVSEDEVSRSAYLRISSFDQQTDDQFFEAMASIPEDRPIILDLCGNSGGNFRIALQIADSFLPSPSVLSYIISRNSTEIVKSKNSKKFKHQITILQDAKTASAAEALIAALVENGRALSIGERTYGKAMLQTFIEISDGSAMLLTTAKLMTPLKHDFDKVGLAPKIRISSSL